MGLRKLLSRLSDSQTIQTRAISAVAWVLSFNAVDRILQIAKLLLLARLLSPAAFGLAGAGILSVNVARRFTDPGLDKALIQHHDENVDEYLDTVWSIKIGRGVVLAVVVTAAAPIVASILNMPQLTRLLPVLGLVPLFIGARNPEIVYFRKDLEFRNEFVYRSSGTVLDIGTALVIVIISPTAWALVGGYTARFFAQMVASYAVSPYRPSLVIDTEKMWEMISYGKWITASSIVLFLINGGDDLFVGWFVGAAALGYYRMAYRLSNAPATEITETITRVMLPVFSKLQNDLERLRGGYFLTLRIVSLVAFPAAVGIAVLAEPFTMALLGKTWRPMVLPMQVLAMLGFLRSIGSTIVPVFEALGHPDYVTKIQTVKMILIAATIFPATDTWGIAGAGGSIVFASVVSTAVSVFICLKLINGSGRQFATIVGYPLGASLMMGGFLAATYYETLPATAVTVVGLVVGGIIIYSSLLLVLDMVAPFDLRNDMKRFVENL